MINVKNRNLCNFNKNEQSRIIDLECFAILKPWKVLDQQSYPVSPAHTIKSFMYE